MPLNVISKTALNPELQTRASRYHSRMITLKRLHVLMPSITFPIDPRHLPSGRACSRLAGGCSSPTLAVTGPLTSEELATRSSVGLLLFVPEGYDKEVIAQSGLRLLVCKNLTTNMAEVAEKRRAAPEKRCAAVQQVEGDRAFAAQQNLLAMVARRPGTPIPTYFGCLSTKSTRPSKSVAIRSGGVPSASVGTWKRFTQTVG